ncbi:hypothetical protein DFJ73DRAFT_177548 [Zopfochytrium polystomum]|nr:hypothetical protein DFJ73DRAFT_177548 [Zopfochytrium polystomum]
MPLSFIFAHQLSIAKVWKERSVEDPFYDHLCLSCSMSLPPSLFFPSMLRFVPSAFRFPFLCSRSFFFSPSFFTCHFGDALIAPLLLPLCFSGSLRLSSFFNSPLLSLSLFLILSLPTRLSASSQATIHQSTAHPSSSRTNAHTHPLANTPARSPTSPVSFAGPWRPLRRTWLTFSSLHFPAVFCFLHCRPLASQD